MSEREYNFVQVFGRARGMNTSGWAGAIDDAEVTYSYNMSTNKDGEWKKRKGYYLLDTINTVTAGETLALHWHTDETAAQADATTWLESGDEVDGTKSGALTVNAISDGGAVTLGGESVRSVYPTTTGSYLGMQSINVPATPDYTNFDATAGRLIFYIQATDIFETTTFASRPPSAESYVFYFSSSFYMKINTAGALVWKYGSAAGEYLQIPGASLPFASWLKIEVAWDNSAGNTSYSTRFRFYLNDSLIASADPAGAVTMSFDATVYWLNTGSAGTSAPRGSNWFGTVFYLANITSYSGSAIGTATAAPPITGIFSNSSQARTVITSGTSVYYGSGSTFTLGLTKTSGAAYTVTQTRTSGTEWLGNYYIVDGTTKLTNVEATGTGGADRLLEALTLPETAKFIATYHGHLWIGNLGTNGAYSVRCSDIDNDNSWTAVNQVFKCKDQVRGMHPYAGALIVGTRSGIEAISGYLPNDFAKTHITEAANCASHWSMVEVPIGEVGTGLIWAGYDGIYMMTGQTVQKISQPIQDFFDTISKTEIEECCAVDNRDTGEYMLSVSDGTLAANNWVLCFNYRKGDWSIWKYANAMDVLGYYFRSGKRTLLGGDTNGNVWNLDRGDSDNGSAIDGYVLTKWFDGGMPDQEKDYRKLYFWHDSPGEWYLQVGHSVNYATSERTADIVSGSDGNDYACIADHMPDVVVGTDGNDYYCILAHTAAAANCPVTGGSYATNWTATGGTGGGQTWAADSEYGSNLEKKPITGSLYLSYWRPNNTVGLGTTWDAQVGYQAARPEFQVLKSVFLGTGSTSKYDTAVYDTAVYAGANIDETKMDSIDLESARGNTIRFMFRNANADQPFAVRGLKAWYTWVPEFPG